MMSDPEICVRARPSAPVASLAGAAGVTGGRLAGRRPAGLAGGVAGGRLADVGLAGRDAQASMAAGWPTSVDVATMRLRRIGHVL